MSDKQPADITTLAAEALDLWQEHLAAIAADPKARADLATWMEPSRRMFAEWVEKAQNIKHGAASFTTAANTSEDGPATVRPSSDDGALRVAQLAIRVAELEVRIARLEASIQRAARKTSEPAG